MKRIYSIFFLAIFLFQIGGYYIVFWAAQENSRLRLLQRLDAEDYSNKELTVLSIPLSMPYPFYEGEYERVDGDFVFQGTSYKLVKQKVENDTLFVVCIRDNEGTQIASVFSDFSKLANDVPVGNKKAVSLLSKMYKDFKSTEFRMMYKSRLLYEQSFLALTSSSYDSPSPALTTPPPKNNL